MMNFWIVETEDGAPQFIEITGGGRLSTTSRWERAVHFRREKDADAFIKFVQQSTAISATLWRPREHSMTRKEVQ